MAYNSAVPETAGREFGDSNTMADDRRSAVFLRPHAFARLLWAGLGGETFGSAGSIVPVRQPRSVPAHHRLATAEWVFMNHNGGRYMRPTFTHAQQQTALEIVQTALRAAATAATYQDALDATGDALVRIAALTKAGAA